MRHWTEAARSDALENEVVLERATRFVGRNLAKLAGHDPDKLLFRGDDGIFVEAVSACTVYGEYGCGASTIWCVNNTTVPIISVDSSAEWISRVRDHSERRNGLKMVHVDLGELGDWGRPVAYGRRSAFSDYIAAPWSHDAKPDLILVDGRFRVACFLQSLVNANEGATILFDDYTERRHYHVVEEFVERVATCGTMAKFVVPTKLDRDAIVEEIKAFTYVMD